MKKAFLCDIDGVVLNWMGSYLNFMKSKGYEPKPVEITDWDLTKNIFSYINPGEFRALIAEFNKTPEYGDLQYLPGALDGVVQLLGLAKEYDWQAVAVTTTGLHPTTVRARAAQVERIGFDIIHCIDFHLTKQEIYDSYPEGSIVLEDNLDHAWDAHDSCQDVILFDYPYNQLDTELPAGLFRVHSWDEAIKVAKGLLEDSIEEAA